NAGGRVSFLGITPPSSSGPGSYDFPSQPRSMNDAGQLILQRGDRIFPTEYDHGKTTPLPGWGVAINDSGQVAGYDGYNRPGLGSLQAYIQSKGVTTQLGVLPGAEESIPAAINNSGQVAGYSEHSFVTNSSGTGVVDAPAGQAWTHAFLYNGSTMVDLGTLGG